MLPEILIRFALTPWVAQVIMVFNLAYCFIRTKIYGGSLTAENKLTIAKMNAATKLHTIKIRQALTNFLADEMKQPDLALKIELASGDFITYLPIIRQYTSKFEGKETTVECIDYMRDILVKLSEGTISLDHLAVTDEQRIILGGIIANINGLNFSA